MVTVLLGFHRNSMTGLRIHKANNANRMPLDDSLNSNVVNGSRMRPREYHIGMSGKMTRGSRLDQTRTHTAIYSN